LGAIGIDKKSNNEIYINAGSNNRLTEFQAIIGITQLNKLESFVKHRIIIAGVYKNKLSELVEDGLIKFQEYPQNIRHPYWMFMVLIENDYYKRAIIKDKLKMDNINISWPYQPLLHQQPVFCGLNQKGLKKSEEHAQKHLCLPIHLGITVSDAEYISTKFIDCFDV
jgi:dTDP-4-amino-4,6-dideoxygalactose transaminase